MTVYYFSGTGNSYIVAKHIAEKLGAELISIPKVMNTGEIQTSTNGIVVVFPSYLGPVLGVPLIVGRFVRKLAGIGALRISAICTCGGYEINALLSLKSLKKIIRSCGGKLSGAFSVRLPMNNLDYDHIPLPIEKDQDVIIGKSRAKLEDISQRLMRGKGAKSPAAKALLTLLMAPFCAMMIKPVTKAIAEKAGESADITLTLSELIPLTDKSITVNDQCTGCGTCVRVCPVNNIVLVDKKPQFQHRCEMCFACDEWCPSQVIRHWSRLQGVKYHHPEVKSGVYVKGDGSPVNIEIPPPHYPTSV